MHALATFLLFVSTVPTATVTRAENFDLAKVPKREVSCANREASDDIIVCARKNMTIVVPDADKFAEKPVRAEFVGPLNSEAKVHAIKTNNPAAPAPAAAVTLKWHF